MAGFRLAAAEGATGRLVGHAAAAKECAAAGCRGSACGEGEDDRSSVTRGIDREEGTNGGRDQHGGGGVERGRARHGSGRWEAALGFWGSGLGGRLNLIPCRTDGGERCLREATHV
jgi:hypothetical protein